jgi:hypothetical protein
MPLVDSRQQMLDLGDLLKVAAENTKSEYPMEFVYASFVKEVQMPDSKFYRYGNTVYVVHRSKTEPRKGMFRALNADTAPNFIASGFAFVVDAYKAGLDTLVTQFSDQSLINIFRNVSKNPPNPGMGYDVTMLNDGQYQVGLQLGNKREGAQQ